MSDLNIGLVWIVILVAIAMKRAGSFIKSNDKAKDMAGTVAGKLIQRWFGK